jgi:iron complex outermembrane receptor protein
MAHWSHAALSGAVSDIQVYVDRTRRTDSVSREAVDTVDIEAGHQFRRLSRHAIQVGLNARFSGATLKFGSGTSHLDPLSDALAGAFVQDEIDLVEDRLTLTAGTKLERTRANGLEWQPAVQLAWALSPANNVWASVARAARTPSLADRTVSFDAAPIPNGNGPPTFVHIFGNPRMKTEHLLAYEAGYRVQLADWLALDWTSFYNVYDSLRTSETGTPHFAANPARVVIPFRAANELSARSYGVEFAAAWRPFSNWKLNTGYSWLRVRPGLSPSSNDGEAERVDKDNPRHQAQLRSYLDLPGRASLDAMIYYVGAVPPHTTGQARPGIPGYTRMDVRIGRALTAVIDASICIEDLLNAEHLEFAESWGGNPLPVESGRRVYGKLTFRF